MKEYDVIISNTFEAESQEEAVEQMISWLLDNASVASYRVFADDEFPVFVDAEDMSSRRFGVHEGRV